MDLACLFTMVAMVLGADAADASERQYPEIEGYGGIVVFEDAAEPPRANSKLLLDVTSDATAEGVVKGLNRAAVMANLYAHAGVGLKQGMKLTVVLHGSATKSVLGDAAYAEHTEGAKNPNLKLIRRLRKAGVEIYVCGQALARNGFHPDQVTPEVTVAVSAATVAVNRQMDGFVLVP